MPWWTWVWVAVLGVAVVAAALLELEERNYTDAALGVLSGCASILGLLVHFRPPSVANAVQIVAPLCLMGAVWLLISTVSEVRRYWDEGDPEMSVRRHRCFVVLGAAAVILLFGPGFALGIRAAVLG